MQRTHRDWSSRATGGGETRMRDALMGGAFGAVVIGVVAVIAAPSARGQDETTKFSTVRVEELQLVDADGNVVGTFGVERSGSPFVELKRVGSGTDGGSVRIDIPLRKGPRVEFRDNAGQLRARMGIGPGSRRSDADPNMHVLDGQIPHISVYAGDGELRGSLGGRPDGSARLWLWSPDPDGAVEIPK